VWAQQVFDAFGKFPWAVPSVFIINYVRAHRLDSGFTTGFQARRIPAHPSQHMQRWHGGPEGG
jgi:hypothetical protein